MKDWVLKNKVGEYLCSDGYYSFTLVAKDNNDCVNGAIVRAEKKSYLSDLMKDFNADIKPEYKVRPVQVELEIKYCIKEIKKENK